MGPRLFQGKSRLVRYYSIWPDLMSKTIPNLCRLRPSPESRGSSTPLVRAPDFKISPPFFWFAVLWFGQNIQTMRSSKNSE